MPKDQSRNETNEETLNQVTSELGSLNPEVVNEKSKTQNRRGVLGAIGGVIASLPLVSLPARAKDRSETTTRQEKRLAKQRRILKKYDSPKTVRAALQNHGSELVSALAEDALLDSGSVDNLNIQSLWNPTEFATSEEGVKVSGATVAGTPTAHVQVAKRTADRRVVLIVQPEIDRSYAIIKGPNTEPELVTATTNGVEPVDYCEPSNHCVADYCSTNPLVDDFTYREVYCCVDSPCYFGEDLGCCEPRATSSNCSNFC